MNRRAFENRSLKNPFSAYAVQTMRVCRVMHGVPPQHAPSFSTQNATATSQLHDRREVINHRMIIATQSRPEQRMKATAIRNQSSFSN